MNEFDNELFHYAKGQTKKNAKYASRIWKNGRWVYEYKITGKGYQKDAHQALRDYNDEWHRQLREEKDIDLQGLAYKRSKAEDAYDRNVEAYKKHSLKGKIETTYDKIDLATPTFYEMKQKGKKKVGNYLSKIGDKLLSEVKAEEQRVRREF